MVELGFLLDSRRAGVSIATMRIFQAMCFLGLTTILSAFGCSSSSPSTAGPGFTVASVDAGSAQCPKGGIAVTEGTTTSYVCNGAPGARGATGVTGAMGTTGEGGAPGPSGEAGAPGALADAGPGVVVTSIQQSDAGDASCPQGGVQITSGSSNSYVCNGVNGTNGGFTSQAVFTATGSFTVPPGVTSLLVEVWGGGGGGGASAPNGSPGGGGGGGGFGESVVAVTPGDVITVTVGGGGTPGSGGNGTTSVPGGPGGTSSFGTLVTATGGQGGSAASEGGPGGVGGTSTSPISSDGATGTSNGGEGESTMGMPGGAAGGGGGPGGDGAPGGSSTPGGNGIVPGGGGGSGGYPANMGGAGASGEVVLFY
jgi:hypothetical protein